MIEWIETWSRIIYRRLPPWLLRPLRQLATWLRMMGWGRNPARWAHILASCAPVPDCVRVFYGFDRIPHPGDVAHGGVVKFQRMQTVLPNVPRQFNILYMVSSARPEDWEQLVWLAQRRKARVVWNQDGVGYPAWHGPGWDTYNLPMKHMIRVADHVFYQSQFCKLSADRFLGERQGPWEILYNAVDTRVFTPASCDPDPTRLILLLGGSQYQYYRLETAIRTLAELARWRSDAYLLVSGRLRWIPDEARAAHIARKLASDLGLAGRVKFLGPYSQQQAPDVFRRAHVLLHTKYNDPCPGLVVEAMACGLPVVYSASGGTPELVGEEAGIGVPAELSWKQDCPPDPAALAVAVLQVAEHKAEYAQAALQRAVEHFDLQPWLKRHREVFEDLVCQSSNRAKS